MIIGARDQVLKLVQLPTVLMNMLFDSEPHLGLQVFLTNFSRNQRQDRLLIPKVRLSNELEFAQQGADTLAPSCPGEDADLVYQLDYAPMLRVEACLTNRESAAPQKWLDHSAPECQRLLNS